jgi:hypothetical protein
MNNLITSVSVKNRTVSGRFNLHCPDLYNSLTHSASTETSHVLFPEINPFCIITEHDPVYRGLTLEWVVYNIIPQDNKQIYSSNHLFGFICQLNSCYSQKCN